MARKRRFNLRQRRALYFAADGRCEACGRELAHGWHADHEHPWSRGGATDVNNGQALCPECNLRKGGRMVMKFEDLRPWQRRFNTLFRAWLEQVFLLVALPGGGKTIAALFAAMEWLSAIGTMGRGRYVVIVVPSRNLRSQWKKVAKKHFNIELQTGEFTGAFKPGMHGYVLTYSGLASDPELFRRLCAMHDVFVIFDEVHHLGEAAVWGISARDAFSEAKRILAMSGTPWRSDTGKIPFLTVDPQTGEYKVDDRFDWPKALEEDPRAARELSFKPYHGSADYQDRRSGKQYSLDSRKETMSEEDEARCLKGRLLESQFIAGILQDAHDQLLHVRKRKADAGGLVVCMDIFHAQLVARILREITGEQPTIAVSDDDVATGRDPIDDFRNSTKKWIVSVRQVSEGVDIPRLMVGVYLTNYITELYFRQFIGRVVRYEGTEDDEEAYVFMPHHSKLTTYANKIMQLQALALKQRETKGDDAPPPGGGGGEAGADYLGGSPAERAGLILPRVNTSADPVSASTISEFARRYGITETAAARIVRENPQISVETEELIPVAVHVDQLPLEDRLRENRTSQHKMIGYLARLTGVEYSDLCTAANRHAGCADVKTATENQLKLRGAYIEARIAEARNAA